VIVGRDSERAVPADFVTRAEGPAAMLVEGEAGIGKTTLLRDALQRAGDRRMLACRPAQAETPLAFAALADLLDGVELNVLPARYDGRWRWRCCAPAGDSFEQTDIATIGDGYLVDRNASMGLADDGTGVVTFLDHGGLEVADLSPLAAPAPPPPGLPGPPRPPRCVNGKAIAHLLGATVILRTTHVHAGDVLAQVSVRSRHRLSVKVRFRYDGRPAHARTRLSVLVHARPGTRHTLLARVYARGRTRTLPAAARARCGLTLTGCAG